jgi:hypothetical protein
MNTAARTVGDRESGSDSLRQRGRRGAQVACPRRVQGTLDTIPEKCAVWCWRGGTSE